MKKKKRFIYALSASLMLGGTLALVSSCGGGDSGETTGATMTIVCDTELKIGETTTLVAKDSSGNELSDVTFTISTGSDCASLSGNVLTAKDAGQVVVVAKKSGYQDKSIIIKVLSNSEIVVASFDVVFSEGNEDHSFGVGQTSYITVENIIDADGASVESADSINLLFTSGDTSIVSVNANGTATFKKAGSTTIKVSCKEASADFEGVSVNVTVADTAVAKGAYSYVASEDASKTYEDKLEILGSLEKWAVKNNLTGMTLFQNGGYVMYNPRIKKPTNNYITGYGFGILSEGTIDADLKGESNDAWKRYYHSYGGTNNKQKYNYLDDTGSESSSLYGYMASGYYSTKMNSTKDGYEWFPLLAKSAEEANIVAEYDAHGFNHNMPLPIYDSYNEKTGLGTKFKVYFKTSEDGIKFHTLSDKAEIKKFDGQGVTLEDYITPYKLLLNGAMDLARSTDMISDSSEGTLKGAKAIFNMTKSNADIEDESIYGKDGTFYKMVGLEPNWEENSITFTFNTPVSQFTAMNNLASTLVSPINVEFLKAIAPAGTSGGAAFHDAMNYAYGTTASNKNSAGSTLTPVDTVLSCGPYTLEYSDQLQIAYKRNDDWIEVQDGRYNIKGIVLKYYSGASQSTNYAFERFIQDEQIDACSIPTDYISTYKDDPRTTQTEGDSTFKLNLNTCTQAEWNSIFKDRQNRPNQYVDEEYSVKPLMSNDSFVKGLIFALDRKTFAEKRGVVPSQSYFAPAYLWDPENGKSYDSTVQHAAAIAEYSPSTYGYNVSLAVQYMDEGIKELINEGKYYSNSSETIRIEWMNTTDTDEYGEEIKQYFEDAFKQTDAYKNGFRLTIENGEGFTDYQRVYDIMKKGTFDMGFGSISGMTNDPLGFLEVLKTDNSAGFTLNYGKSTAEIDDEDPIIYKGKSWSFDGLWAAAKKGAVVGDEGKVVESPVTALGNTAAPKNTMTVTNAESTKIEVYRFAIQVTLDTLVLSSEATFKLFTEEGKDKDESITVSLTYTDSEGATQTAAFNATVENGLAKFDSDTEADGTISEEAYVDVYLPTILNSSTTGGQLTEEIAYSNITAATVYFNYYMVFGDITSSSSLEATLKLR